MPSTTDITMASRPRSKPAGPRIMAILLAAGQSSRMGARNKPLLGIGSQPMVRRVAETLLASRIDAVIAVLGHEHAAIAEALGSLSLRTVSTATTPPTGMLPAFASASPAVALASTSMVWGAPSASPSYAPAAPLRPLGVRLIGFRSPRISAGPRRPRARCSAP